MNKILRYLLVGIGVVFGALAVGFFLQMAWATALWPLPSSRLSNIFLASIFAAMAIPIVYYSLADDPRAVAGGAINLGITNAGFAVFALQLYARTGTPALLNLGIFSIAGFLICAGVFLYSRRFAFRDQKPTPEVVRYSFMLFIFLLAASSSALIQKRPNIFPWPLSPENGVFYGWIFLGALSYFFYAIIYPVWSNARGQLMGFLAYDLVLILPFIAHFREVLPEQRLSLMIYTAALAFSGLLAIFFLFINPTTRFVAAARSQPISLKGSKEHERS